MDTFTHDLLVRHAATIVDRTEYEEVPIGWQALVAVLIHDIAAVLSIHPGQTIEVYQIKEKFGELRIHMHVGDSDFSEAVRLAVFPIVAAATAKSAATCQVCGVPAGEQRKRRFAVLCDVHARKPGTRRGAQSELRIGERRDRNVTMLHTPADDDAKRSNPDRAAVPEPSSHRGRHELYRLRAVADALGRPAGSTEDDAFPDKHDTEHEARLNAILRLGHMGTWRDLAMPEPDMLTRLDALDTAAPHMADVTALIRRHIQAALVVGLPIHLPPVLLLGEPGLGKTWYLTQVGAALCVPTRTYPMTAATLSEGLQGSHPSWRNARSGLVATTLLQETVANPIVLVDEIDKAGQGSFNQDPYRPFYTLLEPAGARSFRDEYLGFEMDASAVMWMLAGNEVNSLPEPILSRITIVTIPALSRHHLAAVAGSIYAKANERMRGFFDPDLASATLDALLDLTPRAIRITLEDAMVRAAANGRKEITTTDLVPRPAGATQRMGFITSRV